MISFSYYFVVIYYLLHLRFNAVILLLLFFQIPVSFFQIWNWNLKNIKQVFHIMDQSHSFFFFFFFDLIYEVIFFKRSKKVWFYGCIFNIFLFSDEQERKNKFILQFFEFFSLLLIVQNDNMVQFYTQKFYIYIRPLR